jgi:hypothetical protein
VQFQYVKEHGKDAGGNRNGGRKSDRGAGANPGAESNSGSQSRAEPESDSGTDAKSNTRRKPETDADAESITWRTDAHSESESKSQSAIGLNPVSRKHRKSQRLSLRAQLL